MEMRGHITLVKKIDSIIKTHRESILSMKRVIIFEKIGPAWTGWTVVDN